MTKKKKVIISVSLSVITIAAILFSLAYKYLIERVETPILTNAATMTTAAKSNDS